MGCGVLSKLSFFALFACFVRVKCVIICVMRAPQFRPSIYRQGTRVRWRVFIPASLSADGTRQAVYYDTKSEALDDAARLRELHARGEIVQSAVLTASQRKDAAAAVAALAAAGLNMSLAECAQLAIEQRARMARGCSLAALLDAYEQEVAPARGWSAPYLRSWRGYARITRAADATGQDIEHYAADAIMQITDMILRQQENAAPRRTS